MSIFKSVRKHQTLEQDDTVVHDFLRRAPYWSYRVTDYRPYAPFSDFRGGLDGYLEKLLAGEIDDGNGDVLDNLIGDMARQALLDLEKQRADHQDYLRSLDARTVGDRDQFQRCRDALERDLNRNLQEQAALEQRADRHTFREE